MFKQIKLALVAAAMLAAGQVTAMDTATLESLYDVNGDYESQLVSNWVNNPMTAYTSNAVTTTYDAALGFYRGTAARLAATFESYMIAQAGANEDLATGIFPNINHNSVWRDTISATPSSLYMTYLFYPATANNQTVAGEVAAAGIAWGLTAAFQVGRFYAQEVCQLALRYKYNLVEETARWACWGVSFTTAQIFAAYVIPRSTAALVAQIQTDENRRRQLISASVKKCDSSVYLATRNKWPTGSFLWNAANVKYQDCLNQYSKVSPATSYAEEVVLFPLAPDGYVPTDPDASYTGASTTFTNRSIADIMKFYRDNIILENLLDSTTIPSIIKGAFVKVTIPAATLNNISMPKIQVTTADYPAYADGSYSQTVAKINSQSTTYSNWWNRWDMTDNSTLPAHGQFYNYLP